MASDYFKAFMFVCSLMLFSTVEGAPAAATLAVNKGNAPEPIAIADDIVKVIDVQTQQDQVQEDEEPFLYTPSEQVALIKPVSKQDQSADFIKEQTVAETEHDKQTLSPNGRDVVDESRLADDTSSLTLLSGSDVDLTPEAVAEYLLLSGDFNGFNQALNELVQEKILTPLEVARYKRIVGWEYENILQTMLEAEATYLQFIAKPILEELVLSGFSDEEAAVDTGSDGGMMENAQHFPAEQLLQGKPITAINKPEYGDQQGENRGSEFDSMLEALVTKHDKVTKARLIELQTETSDSDSEEELNKLIQKSTA